MSYFLNVLYEEQKKGYEFCKTCATCIDILKVVQEVIGYKLQKECLK